MDHVNYILVLLIGLLCAVAAVAGLARRLSVSYPIVLVIFGLLCSLLPHVPHVQLSPSLVFLVILPPLLYAAAWQTSWRDFKYNLVSISSLAVLLVFFTAFGVAFAAKWWLPGFTWQLGFLLGAVVSPTDAVAATSIARKVGMPQRIVDLLEGESLLNDATGLLAMQFGVQMVVQGTTPTVGYGIALFAWLAIGGALVGLAIGLLVVWLEHWVDDGPVEIALSLIVPYAAYLMGNAVKGSGVIAVVVCGLFISRRSSTFFSPGVRLQAWAVWDALEFLLNGLVFVLLGLQLPYVLNGIHGHDHLSLLKYALVFCTILVLLRLVWMYPGTRATWWVRTHVLKADIRKAETKSGFCHGMDRDAWGRRPGRGKLIASHAQRWKSVPSAKHDHLSHVFFDPGNTCSARSFLAMAGTCAWTVCGQRAILRRRRGQAPGIAGWYRLPWRTQEVSEGRT